MRSAMCWEMATKPSTPSVRLSHARSAAAPAPPAAGARAQRGAGAGRRRGGRRGGGAGRRTGVAAVRAKKVGRGTEAARERGGGGRPPHPPRGAGTQREGGEERAGVH